MGSFGSCVPQNGSPMPRGKWYLKFALLIQFFSERRPCNLTSEVRKLDSVKPSELTDKMTNSAPTRWVPERYYIKRKVERTSKIFQRPPNCKALSKTKKLRKWWHKNQLKDAASAEIDENRSVSFAIKYLKMTCSILVFPAVPKILDDHGRRSKLEETPNRI